MWEKSRVHSPRLVTMTYQRQTNILVCRFFNNEQQYGKQKTAYFGHIDAIDYGDILGSRLCLELRIAFVVF